MDASRYESGENRWVLKQQNQGRVPRKNRIGCFDANHNI